MQKPRPKVPTMDRLAARMLEMRDEELAPAIQRQAVLDRRGNTLREPLVERVEWNDPDDTNPNRRSARRVSGFQRYDVLRRVALTNPDITDQHLDAAETLARDWEMASGGGSGSLGTERVDAPPTYVLPPIVHMTRFRKAVQAVGQVGCAVLLPVVLRNITLSALAESRRMSRSTLRQHLIGALDRLVDHYGL